VIIAVDAATKAVPLLQLMALAQKDAAATLVGDETVQPCPPPYTPGVPALGTLAGGSFLLLASRTEPT
jgi:hypothetical protein